MPKGTVRVVNYRGRINWNSYYECAESQPRTKISTRPPCHLLVSLRRNSRLAECMKRLRRSTIFDFPHWGCTDIVRKVGEFRSRWILSLLIPATLRLCPYILHGTWTVCSISREIWRSQITIRGLDKYLTRTKEEEIITKNRYSRRIRN